MIPQQTIKEDVIDCWNLIRYWLIIINSRMSYFLSYFRSLISKDCDITIELKSGVSVTGKIKYIDNNMGIFLEEISLKDPETCPQMNTMANMFVRGSSIRYIHPPFDEAQLGLVSEACVSGGK